MLAQHLNPEIWLDGGSQYLSSHGSSLRRVLRSLRVVQVLADIPGHMRLLHAVHAAGLSEQARQRRLMVFKYLHRSYLAAGLSTAERLSLLTSHYAWLARLAPASWLRRLFHSGDVVWRQNVEGEMFEIVLSVPRWGSCFTGDLRLHLRAGGRPVYKISGTIAGTPGKHWSAPSALLVTAVQGAPDNLLVRHATQCFHDTPPAYLLMAAVEGLARALGLRALVGPGRERHQSAVTQESAGLVFDYDYFWNRLGAQANGTGYYELEVPIPVRPLSSIKAKHRRKTAQQRELKQQVCAEVEESVRASLAGVRELQ